MAGWTLLLGVITLSVIGNSLLKVSDGLVYKSYLIIALMVHALAYVVFSYVLKSIPIGIAYAFWSGIAIILLTVVGWFLFKENVTSIQLAWISVIVIGCVGLNLSVSS